MSSLTKKTSMKTMHYIVGIVLLDLLSTGGVTGMQVVTFSLLFFMALVFQRFVPAT